MSDFDEPTIWRIVSFMTTAPLWVLSATSRDNHHLLRRRQLGSPGTPFFLNAEFGENTYNARGWSLVFHLT